MPKGEKEMKCPQCAGETLLVRERIVTELEEDVTEACYTCEDNECDTKIIVYYKDKDDDDSNEE